MSSFNSETKIYIATPAQNPSSPEMYLKLSEIMSDTDGATIMDLCFALGLSGNMITNDHGGSFESDELLSSVSTGKDNSLSILAIDSDVEIMPRTLIERAKQRHADSSWLNIWSSELPKNDAMMDDDCVSTCSS